MKIKRLILLGILPAFIFSLSACNSIFDFLDDDTDSSGEKSSDGDDKDLDNKDSDTPGEDKNEFETINISSEDWYSFSNLSFMGWDHFMSMTLGSSNGITLKLIGNLNNYKVTKVKVFAKSKKPYAEGLYYEADWPVDSNGNCRKQLYIKTGFVAKYGFTASISAIYGTVKPTDSFLKDKDGFLWKKIENDDNSASYSFSGKNSIVENVLYRLPEKANDVIPTKIGFHSFDMFGLENVKKVIIPANYTDVYIGYFWNKVNFEELYYEGSENNLTTYDFQKSSVKMYRESEPDPNIDIDEYIYWHYVDGYPQIW